ncbi:hypothetical protein [Hymenobacter cellulosilyticus]|uniref:Uncharacterized protein n=1 Tax=Hymenobacter cellulosilyticus TaxID=2932248 RepID=A0A8T9Q5B2_9BACT|nr:hypothetical protein [Hymenobacter cellulosilyticus]UOQ72152.1 hypothetical protein MUN79_26915 [Hymenobacter cellulosilyticus]
MSNFPIYGGIAVVVMLVMQYLNKAAKQGPRVDAEGNSVLLPRFYGVLGLLAAAAGTGVLLYGLFDYNPENIGPQLGLFALFAGLGLPLVLMAYVHRLTLTRKESGKRICLGRRSLFGGTKSKPCATAP